MYTTLTPSCEQQEVPVGAVQAAQTMSEDQLLTELVRRWTSHQEDGQKVRLEMGQLLNKHLGPPTERQPHGREVVKRAAERLDIFPNPSFLGCDGLGTCFRTLRT